MLCIATVGAQIGVAQTPSMPADSAQTATTNSGDLQQLRETIALQEKQIQRLQQAVEDQQKLLEKELAAAKAASANAASTDAASTAGGNTGVPTASTTNPKLIPVVNGPAGSPHQKPSTLMSTPSPLSVSIGNTTFTPLGFLDATYFFRTTNVGSGIGTNFLGIPYNNVAAYHLQDSSFSAQNSRLGLRVDSNFLGSKVLGYFEGDFLFNNDAPTVQITSNSDGFRLRCYFVDVEKNGFEVLAGQDWSMMTPNRKGISPLPGDIFYTQNMDTNYQLGLVWTRAPQVRFIAHPTENVAFGVALENQQQYIGGGSGASTVTLPANLNSSLSSQFQSGQSSFGVPGFFPDIQFKGAYDGHAGDKLEHVEAEAMVMGFKDYVTLTTPPAIHGSHTAVGYAGSINANLELVKNLRMVINTYASEGGGRYIFGTVPDVVIRPDGSISTLKAYSTVDGFEGQVSKNTVLTAYYGGMYAGKDVVFDTTGTKPGFVGYGYPNSGQVRTGQEITFGWIQTLWKNPNYGALSMINQYSYVFKEPWYVATIGGPRQAHTNMIYIDLRYTLP